MAKTFLDQKDSAIFAASSTRAHQYDAEKVVGWDFEHSYLLINRTPSAVGGTLRLGPRARVLDTHYERATPGGQSTAGEVAPPPLIIEVTR